MLAYESTLAAFSLHFYGMELKDFEPPVGTDRLEEWLDNSWGRMKPSDLQPAPRRAEGLFPVPGAQGPDARRPDVARSSGRRSGTCTAPRSRRTRHAASSPARRSCGTGSALRLLLHYGLRRGLAGRAVQALRPLSGKRLTVFTEGRARSAHAPAPATRRSGTTSSG